MFQRFTLAVVSTLVTLTPTRGQIIAYDPFNQNPGPLNGTMSTGVPWPTVAPWTSQFGFGAGGFVQGGSLGYGPLAVAGNKSQFDWANSNNGSFRSLGENRGGAPADFWISFLADFGRSNQGLRLYSGAAAQMLLGAPSAN